MTVVRLRWTRKYLKLGYLEDIFDFSHWFCSGALGTSLACIVVLEAIVILASVMVAFLGTACRVSLPEKFRHK
jgi:hypothetical protein